MVILLEVAQSEIVGKLWDASSLSLRLEMPRQTVLRKFAELEERSFVMKERRERRRMSTRFTHASTRIASPS